VGLKGKAGWLLGALALLALAFQACPGRPGEDPVRRLVTREDLGAGLRVGLSVESLPAEGIELGPYQLEGPIKQESEANPDLSSLIWYWKDALMVSVAAYRGRVQKVEVGVVRPELLSERGIPTLSGLEVGRTERDRVVELLGEPDWSFEHEGRLYERYITIDETMGRVYELILTYQQREVPSAVVREKPVPPEEEAAKPKDEKRPIPLPRKVEYEETGEMLPAGWLLVGYAYSAHGSVEVARKYLEQGRRGPEVIEEKVPPVEGSQKS